MKTMKRSALLAAAVFALSTSALAESTLPSKAVQLNDAQLDEVTAAGAFSAVLLANPGKSNVLNGDLASMSGHLTCVNCEMLVGLLVGLPTEGRATGAVVVINRGHPQGLIRCIGSGFGGMVC
jgi:hypothetical protein